MAKNPMQRRANTSFLLGMLITLLVAALIIGFLVVQLVNSRKEIESLQTSKTGVLVLNQSVTSGQTITTDMLDEKQIDRNIVPENSFSSENVLLDYSLEDEYGNPIKTTKQTKEIQGNNQYDELYIIMNEATSGGGTVDNVYKIREVVEGKPLQEGEEYGKYYRYGNPEFAYDESDLVNVVRDNEGKFVSAEVYVNDNPEAVEEIEGRYYTRHMNSQPGQRYQASRGGDSYYIQTNTGTAQIQQDGDIYFFMNGSTRVNLIKVGTDSVEGVTTEVKFYSAEDNNEKIDWVVSETPLVAKVDLAANTVMTNSLVTTTSERITKDLRRQEYNIIALPSQIQTGEYIDIRLRLPDGTDYIVVSHKEVEIPTISGIDTINNIIVQLSEDEILLMSNAIVESYMMPGSLLYATRYVEPGLQDSATPTYVPSNDVLALFNSNNSNITEIALQELQERYNEANRDAAANIRNNINSEIEKTEADDRIDAVIEGTEEELTRIQEERQLYIDSLGN